jgi:hypothetical protein
MFEQRYITQNWWNYFIFTCTPQSICIKGFYLNKMSPRIYSNTICSSIEETLTLSSIMKVKWEYEHTVSVNRWVMRCCDVYISIYHCYYFALLMCYVQSHSTWCNFLWSMKSENHAQLKRSTQYRIGNISKLFYHWTLDGTNMKWTRNFGLLFFGIYVWMSAIPPNIRVFWNVMLYSLADRYQHFRGNCCLQL